MSISPQQPQRRKKEIEEGINFILNYYPKYNIFTRAISTQALPRESPIIIHYKNEMFRPYEQSSFIDCKVTVYPFTTEKFIQYHEIPRKKTMIISTKTPVRYHFQ